MWYDLTMRDWRAIEPDPKGPSCYQCGNIWQWGGKCPECVTLEDKAIGAANAKAARKPPRVHKIARGLNDHKKAARNPTRQPGMN